MLKPDDPQPPSPTNQRFVTTHWSVVLAGGDKDSPHATAALEELCRTYWYPLYAYIRRRGHPVEAAQDLTQEFFARLIEKRWLAGADANKGRFRSFLLTALNRFMANEWHRAQAAKRGGGQPLISLDDTAEARYALEPVSHVTPEKIYERRWALSLFDRALARLREQHLAAGKSRLYGRLKQYLSDEARDGDYVRLGAELGMNPGAVAAAVHRLRQHYRALVREEVAQTVESPAEIDDEVRALLAALD
jgi:RNA polymerase sigma-70 factor (ECF subfamily)